MSDQRDRFTPGPWDVYVTAGLYSIQHLHADKRVEDIAHSIADEHNARLIAAAPALLAALREARELMMTHQFLDAYATIDAALALAGGG